MSLTSNASLEDNYNYASNSNANAATLTSPSSGSKTVVKYEKSSCLFCNDWFDSQTFTEHLIHCGQVLEQCPNTCSVFVPRIRMRAHLKECPRSKQALKQKRASSMEHLDSLVEHRVQIMEHDLNTVRSVLNEEIRQRLHLITDVGNLRKQNQIADEWTHKTEEAINTLKRRLDEENAQRVFDVEQCQNDYRCCYDETQTLKIEYKNDLDELQEHINRVSISVTEHQNHLNDNIMKLEETVVDNERLNRNKFLEVEEFLEQVNQDLKTQCATNAEPSVKLMNLDYEVKAMKNIVCETEERCDKLESLITDMDKKLHYTMQAVADLENHVATQQRLTSIINTKGHLVWRIKDYSKKMEEAKQYDSILHSAMFSNRQYGYALRLDIFLNGRGSWRGRNMIACLNVIAGEYDPLLAWPCRLKADIIVRDQGGVPPEAQDYVKTISVRKKSDELMNTNQYFHIPHKEILNYVRNDCLFVEVRVK